MVPAAGAPNIVGSLYIFVKDCIGLKDANLLPFKGKSNPYVCLELDGCKLQRTSTRDNTLNPVWNELITFDGVHKPALKMLKIKVCDDDNYHDDTIGYYKFDLGQLKSMDAPQDFSLVVDRRMFGWFKATLNISFKTSGWGS